MLYQIKNCFTDAVLFTFEAKTLKEAVEEAVATGVNLTGANLYGANLCGANLIGANLYRANLDRANLSGANLTRANLDCANLIRANLSEANLSGANLYCASLDRANLSGANLYGANLSGANLYGANLKNAKLPGFQIPQEGALIVWKKLRNQVVAKLLIPAEAARTASLAGRKCRAEYADVLLLVAASGREVTVGESLHDRTFAYALGQRVTPGAYDGDTRQECLPGIHFFQSREEAQAYN